MIKIVAAGWFINTQHVDAKTVIVSKNCSDDSSLLSGKVQRRTTSPKAQNN
jgi:hypothetical protein